MQKVNPTMQNVNEMRLTLIQQLTVSKVKAEREKRVR
jgi:hypothetical protein